MPKIGCPNWMSFEEDTMRRLGSIFFALLAFALLTGIAEAGTIRLQRKHTRAQIGAACAKVGGTAFGTTLRAGSTVATARVASELHR